MISFKVLSNQNKLYSETTCQANYSNEKSDFSIRLAFSGYEEYHLSEKVIKVYPGYFLVLNDGTSYQRAIYTNTPANTFSVQFSKCFLSDFHRTYVTRSERMLDLPFDSGLECPVFTETLYPFKNDIMFNISHLKNHFDSGLNDELLMNEYIYHCLFLFYEIYNKEINIRRNRLNLVKTSSKKEIFKRLNIVKDYIISNYNRPVSIEEISRLACLSECHLYKLFKELYECSPHQYMLRIKLKRATYLLKNSSYPINEVVNLVGFDNSSSFIRLFGKTYGMTPNDYRKYKTA